MKKRYGVVQIFDSNGETVKVFKIKNTTPIHLTDGKFDGCVDFYDDKKEADNRYHDKLSELILKEYEDSCTENTANADNEKEVRK